MLFDFYVTQVVHVIDCQGKSAYTQLTGQYGRPAGGIVSMVNTPLPNTLYADSTPAAVGGASDASGILPSIGKAPIKDLTGK